MQYSNTNISQTKIKEIKRENGKHMFRLTNVIFKKRQLNHISKEELIRRHNYLEIICYSETQYLQKYLLFGDTVFTNYLLFGDENLQIICFSEKLVSPNYLLFVKTVSPNYLLFVNTVSPNYLLFG